MTSNQNNLPSTVFFKEGRRGNIDAANIANKNEKKMEQDMDKLILDAKMDENGELHNNDLKELQNQGEQMVRSKNKNFETTYRRYQNLWYGYICRRNIKNELDDIYQTTFFQSIKISMLKVSCG